MLSVRVDTVRKMAKQNRIEHVVVEVMTYEYRISLRAIEERLAKKLP